MNIDKYLKEVNFDEEDFIDTAEFKIFFGDYKTAVHKAQAKLEKDMTLWVTRNKVNSQSDDVKQWVKDDMGEYALGAVPEHIRTNILNLIKR